MPPLSYIPLRSQDLRAWALNFAALIEADPFAYGLSPGEAAHLRSYVSAFDAALSLAVDPITRTSVHVAAKDSARAAMVTVLRGYAQRIKRNRGISSAAKVSLGLTIADPVRTRLPAPVSAPMILPVAAQPLEHTVRFADHGSPLVRAKPRGVAGLQLFVAVADNPPPGPNAAEFQAFITRQPFAVAFKASQRNKTAHYFGRWQTQRGLTGPWSAMASLGIV